MRPKVDAGPPSQVPSLGAADLSVRIASAPTTATATINATQSTAGWRSVQGAGSAYPGVGVSVPRPAEAAASRSAGVTARVLSQAAAGTPGVPHTRRKG